MKMRFIVTLLLVLLTNSAFADKPVGIIAIVNDKVISTFDLRERVRATMFSTNLPKGQGIEKQIAPQTLQKMIDERIYMQEAKRLGIKVTEKDINKVLFNIEKQNKIQEGQFSEYVQSYGISADSFIEQIRGQIAWQKIIAKVVRPKISISDNEIAERMERDLQKPSKEAFKVSKIELPFDNAKQRRQIKKLADRLVKQLAKGADFTKVAQEFSEGISVSQSKKPIWISRRRLTDKEFVVLSGMKDNDISRPVLVGDSYVIFKLHKKRMGRSNPTEDMKAAIYENLFHIKMKLQAKRYMQNLHKGVFIEVLQPDVSAIFEG